MRRILIITGAVVIVLASPKEPCTIRLEKVHCSDKDQSELLYTCESRPGVADCSCILDNPLLSEVGWFKTCHAKNTLKIRKKKVRKRQTEVDAVGTDRDLCETISPPNPGKVSCTVTRTDIKCLGACDPDFQFIDGTQKQDYSCQYAVGLWKPGVQFPPCVPRCEPPCKNGGTCLSVNFCSCSNDFRGNACQYPITLCSFSKNRLASNWMCNHTRTETTCDISCRAPGTPEAEVDVRRYECTIEGVWNPLLPPCVQVSQCLEPQVLPNGRWQLHIGHVFGIGSRVAYVCEEGFLLRGESYITCKENLTWSGGAPACIQKQALCRDPGETPNGHRNISTPEFFEGSLVAYSCVTDNFTLLGDPIIRCLANGQWSSRRPQCIPAENTPAFCSKPSAPKNSVVRVVFPNQHPLTTVFNKDIPLSQRLYVIHYAQGQQSDLSVVPEGTFVVGTRVQYKCKSRYYKLYGSEYQTCQSSRTWSGYQPACIPECGRSDSPKTPFIINGNSSQIGQWPWQVGLALKGSQGLQLLCGGALISESWVLTAAHCVARKLSNRPVDPDEILVFSGKYYRSFERDDEDVQVKQVRQILVHEEYDFSNFDVDIALLQLESPVELTSRAQPICLPNEETTRENVRDGKVGIVIGWGLTENGKYSDTLKETPLPVVAHDRCEAAYREGRRFVTITRNMFCAGHESGRQDTCNGDSGGPYMFAVGPANDNRWFLEGLVSWGSESGCGKAALYSGFTKVGRFMPWINMFI